VRHQCVPEQDTVLNP